MLIKRYHVHQKSEANARILQELGPEALVLTCMPSADEKKFVITAGIEEEDFHRFRGPDAVFPQDDEEITPQRQQPLSTAGKALENLIQRSIDNIPPSKVPSTNKIAAFLISKGLDKSIADKIDASLSKDFPNFDMSTADPQRENCLDAIRNLLTPYLPTGVKIPSGTKQPAVVAIVGPAASGSTTVLAKIALKIAEERQWNVAVIAFSDARAFMPLREKGVAVHLAADRAQLLEALKICHTCHALFIDPPQGVEAIEKLLKGIPHLEVHLALSATMKSEDQLHALRSYQSLNPVSLIVTMVDQTKSPVSIANALIHSPLLISAVAGESEIFVADSRLLVYNLLSETGFMTESLHSHVS